MRDIHISLLLQHKNKYLRSLERWQYTLSDDIIKSGCDVKIHQHFEPTCSKNELGYRRNQFSREVCITIWARITKFGMSMYPHGAHLPKKIGSVGSKMAAWRPFWMQKSHFLTTVLGNFLNHNIYGAAILHEYVSLSDLKKLWNTEVIRFKMADRRPSLSSLDHKKIWYFGQ